MGDDSGCAPADHHSMVPHGLHATARKVAQPLLGGLRGAGRLGWTVRDPVRRDQRAGTPQDLPPAERLPLHAAYEVHAEADLWHRGWPYHLPTAPGQPRGCSHVGARRNAAVHTLAPAELSRLVRAEGLRLGLSEVGFAPYDPSDAWAEHVPEHETGSVIVCVYEQDGELWLAEQSPFFASGAVVERAAALAEFVELLGGRAQPHDALGEALVIPYALRAGLLPPGRLLTPAAASCVRIALITTDVRFATARGAGAAVSARPGMGMPRI
jgi:hypothetical protein